MKTLILGGLVLVGYHLRAQSLVGTWQLTDEKTCFESEMKESETEKELRKDMSSSKNAVARVIRFDKKGGGDEAVFAVGIKKGTNKNFFKYKVNGQELLLLDIKSGIMTQQWVIDSISASGLKIHNAKKDCETKTFSRIK